MEATGTMNMLCERALDLTHLFEEDGHEKEGPQWDQRRHEAGKRVRIASKEFDPTE